MQLKENKILKVFFAPSCITTTKKKKKKRKKSPLYSFAHCKNKKIKSMNSFFVEEKKHVKKKPCSKAIGDDGKGSIVIGVRSTKRLDW